MDVQVPEPFLSAIREGRPHLVCDTTPSCPNGYYGRAITRLQVGRNQDARSDFETAAEALGDVCRVEILNLDMLEHADLEKVVRECEKILRTAEADSSLRARVCHVAGIAEGRRRRISESTQYLVEASSIYRSLEDRTGWARVQDTLGSLYYSRGRLDLALSAFAVSMVEKADCGDRYGVAVTLGNMGRVHLRWGRFREALDCLERDHRFASEIGNRRICARILEDQGRVYLAMKDLAAAEKKLRDCLEISLNDGFKDLEFYARMDLARVHTAAGKLEKSAAELSLAQAVFTERHDLYMDSLLDEARGELHLAQGREDALELLERTARRFGELNLPDNEISLLLTLAEAYRKRKLKGMAHFCLNRARDRARSDGYERFLRPIREAMVKVGDSDWRGFETDRLPGANSDETSDGGYTLFEQLGTGGFGTVHRAYDSVHDQIVAIKRIELEKTYDVSRREDLVTSAKLELEVASKVRHPGVARVFAIGMDSANNLYIVQEFIKGHSLRRRMAGERPDIRVVVETIQLIAGPLDALHRQGIVHHDLKPENIILRVPAHTPVLVDFGLSQITGFDEGFRPDQIHGTLAYLAPERLRGSVADAKADIYSLGVILYEWLTGSPPRRGSLSASESFGRTEWDSAIELLRRDPRNNPSLVQLAASLLHPIAQLRPSAVQVAENCAGILLEDSEGEVWIPLDDLWSTGLLDTSS